MMKKIDIAGIKLDNYTVREAVLKAEKMLSNNEFNTIEEVGLKTIKCAEHDDNVKHIIMSLDVTVISDVGIISAVGELTMQRKHEIEDRDFCYELMKRIERNHKAVYILADSDNNVCKVKEYIDDTFSRINIAGWQIIEDGWSSIENIVNEINSSDVDVIVSVMSSPMQENFLSQCRGMLSARLWYGAEAENFTEVKKNVFKWIKNRINVHKLSKYIRKYQEKE